jgi:hypothetical protein
MTRFKTEEITKAWCYKYQSKVGYLFKCKQDTRYYFIGQDNRQFDVPTFLQAIWTINWWWSRWYQNKGSIVPQLTEINPNDIPTYLLEEEEAF